MAKPKTHYVCQECGATFPQKWGKCLNCGSYDSLVEEVVSLVPDGKKRPSLNSDSWMREYGEKAEEKQSGQPRSSVKLTGIAEQKVTRCSSGYGELDRVLGGGIVSGSLVLIGGEPGIGKSTLLLQVANQLAQDYSVLYVSGEESGQQVKLRAQRLLVEAELDDDEKTDNNDNREHDPEASETAIVVAEPVEEELEELAVADALPDTTASSSKGSSSSPNSLNSEANFYLLPETDLEEILRELESLKPYLAVIDSIQTIYFPSLTSAPGSVAQVRECTSALMQVAKRENITLFIVGHVTKEGGIAGPRVLEHLVDTVLFFEGDRFASHRLLRSMKNRFGATHEIGVFEMVARGLVEVPNASELFLGSREDAVSGSSTIVACEGTRPIVVELQALVSPSSYGSPRRATTGVDSNRLQQILAVLEKRVGVPLSKLDTYLASVGGLTVSEPAADLGVAIAIVSSFRDRIVDPHTVIIGEVGLGGQVRPVSQLELRLREAAKLGFRRAIVPKRQMPGDLGLEIIPVAKVLDAIVEAIPGPQAPESALETALETADDWDDDPKADFYDEQDSDENLDHEFDSEEPLF
ncbi:MAG: DNA repair protein RadA [Oscillatoria sp. SIO1A7]|nr:DNA repair protein RadA [Oscillatoria sp. SIO1A7]